LKLDLNLELFKLFASGHEIKKRFFSSVQPLPFAYFIITFIGISSIHIDCSSSFARLVVVALLLSDLNLHTHTHSTSSLYHFTVLVSPPSSSSLELAEEGGGGEGEEEELK
jgi:hypothetical protein